MDQDTMKSGQRFRIVITAETAFDLREQVLQLADSYMMSDEVIKTGLNEMGAGTPHLNTEEFEQKKQEANQIYGQGFEAANQNSVPATIPFTSEQYNKLPEEQKVEAAMTGVQIPKRDDDPVPQEPQFEPAPGTLDSKGLPWDERIHSAAKSHNKDGSWRYRRGVEDAEIQKVEAELRSKMGLASSTPQTFVAPPVPAPIPEAAPVAVESQPIVQPVVPQDVVPSQFQTTTQEPPKTYNTIPVPDHAQAKPAYDLASFKKNFAMIMANLITEGKINREYITQLNGHFGLKEIWDITKDDAKTSELLNGFATAGFITRIG